MSTDEAEHDPFGARFMESGVPTHVSNDFHLSLSSSFRSSSSFIEYPVPT